MSEHPGTGADSGSVSNARDVAVRRGRRLRSGIIAAGVAGSLGLAGVAAASTLGSRQVEATQPAAGSEQPQTAGSSGQHQTRPSGSDDHRTRHGDDGAGEDDDGAGGWTTQQTPAPQPTQPQFAQPPAPGPGANSGPHALTSGS